MTRCWWHGEQKCPDKAQCKRSGNFYPPAHDARDVSLHRPNRYGSWAEEAHAARYPGVPWDGIVADLSTPEVRAKWSNWGQARDGRQGPVVKTGDKRELEALCKTAGVRMMEPGEVLKPQTMRDRMQGSKIKLRDYLQRR